MAPSLRETQFKRGNWQETQDNMPLPLRRRHGSKGREQRKKRVERILCTASFLECEIALARPNLGGWRPSAIPTDKSLPRKDLFGAQPYIPGRARLPVKVHISAHWL